jgi:hypothetical protein
MYGKTGDETASRVYSAVTAVLELFDNTGTQAISQEELKEIFSASTGKLSIASVVIGGPDRAARFAEALWEDLFPTVPAQAEITGVIFILQGADDMTTEEYASISKNLLDRIPDDAQTIFSICSNESIAGSFKGSLLLTWKTCA